jgi:hypothetical protein
MNSEQMRTLADILEPMAAAPRFDDLPVSEFCAWLRQCAEQRPVAWSDGLGSFIEADEKVGDDPDILAYRVPLYAAPATPQTEPKREPLSDDEISKLAWKQNIWTDGMIEFSFLAFARAVERAHGIGGSDDD